MTDPGDAGHDVGPAEEEVQDVVELRVHIIITSQFEGL